ncbi:MAG: RDD family protein [Candidatus Bathyarchaeia archaeon]|jgi:uncharacterized RDD family membrane protein YckC
MTTSSEQIDWTNWIYRLIALIIDSIIAGIPAWVIYSFLIVPLLWTSTVVLGVTVVTAPWWAGVLLWPLIYGIILVLYSAILELTWNGQTVGKRIMGLQVHTTNGSARTFGTEFIRNISKIYWLLLLLDWLLAIISTSKQQKYTDRMANTIVLQIRQAQTAPPPPPPPPPPT